MDYSKIKVPFLSKKDIELEATKFTKKYIQKLVLPIDIEKIIEFELGVEIMPIPKLMSYCDVDALITSNWKTIYVDEGRYMDDKYQNRLRFSLAHEIGHLVLHKNIYKEFRISTYSDFYTFIEDVPRLEYGHLETQANKFAGYALMPRKMLEKERNKLLSVLPSDIRNLSLDVINPYLLTPLSCVFGVSEQSIEIALYDLNI